MGNVFQAIDLEDFSLVAIKVIHLHLMQEAGMRRRFLQEVNAIPRLEHPSIVKVHEAGIDTDHNLLYLTMDYPHRPQPERLFTPATIQQPAVRPGRRPHHHGSNRRSPGLCAPKRADPP
ncbi:MAG: hypothetical protein M5U34_04950 [Chloroflexi bacterium]|nr:hypothetical protein [Chloroflexota bacterium]